MGHLVEHWWPGSNSLIVLQVLASSSRILMEILVSDAGVTVRAKGEA